MLLPSKDVKIYISGQVILHPEHKIVENGNSNLEEDSENGINTLSDINVKFCLNVNEVSDDTEMRMELEEFVLIDDETISSENTRKRPTITVKTSFDLIEATLNSKKLELEQVDDELERIREQVRVLSNKQSDVAKPHASKGGKDKKRKKKIRASNVDDEPPSPSIVENVTSAVILASSLCVEYRSFILFGVSAIGIFLVGDYASV